MDEQPSSQSAPEPITSPNEPAQSPLGSIQPEPKEQEQTQPKKKNNSTLIIILAVISFVALAIACCLLFLSPKSTPNNFSTQDDSSTTSETQSGEQNSTQDDDNSSQALISDGEWEILFPETDTSDEAVFGFTLPAGVTDIQSTINKQLYPYYGHEIISITTNTGVYGYETICNTTENLGTFAGYYRVPHGETMDDTDERKFYLALEDDDSDYYVGIGLDGSHTCTEFNATKFEEARTILKELFEVALE